MRSAPTPALCSVARCDAVLLCSLLSALDYFLLCARRTCCSVLLGAALCSLGLLYGYSAATLLLLCCCSEAALGVLCVPLRDTRASARKVKLTRDALGAGGSNLVHLSTAIAPL